MQRIESTYGNNGTWDLCIEVTNLEGNMQMYMRDKTDFSQCCQEQLHKEITL